MHKGGVGIGLREAITLSQRFELSFILGVLFGHCRELLGYFEFCALLSSFFLGGGGHWGGSLVDGGDGILQILDRKGGWVIIGRWGIILSYTLFDRERTL